MRIIIGDPNKKTFDREMQSRDITLVNGLFCESDEGGAWFFNVSYGWVVFNCDFETIFLPGYWDLRKTLLNEF